MQIGDFNSGVSGRFRQIIDRGEPVIVTNHSKPHVTITDASLFDELVQAAGKRGQEVLARYRAEAEQRKQQEAAA